MKPVTKRMSIMFGLVLALVAVLALGKFLRIRQLIADAPKPVAQTVTTARAELLDWQLQFNAVGTLMPVRGVDVTTEVTGLVRKVHFKSGQEVKAGELLVEMNADTDTALLQSLQASADLSAKVLARDRQQFEAKAISQAQLDADEADLRVKRANTAQQQALVAKKTIRAPFAGRIGITTVNPGQYLNPGDKIVTLQTVEPIHVDFNLPQKLLGSLSVGQVVVLSSDAFPGQRFPGKVSAISPKIDTATRNVQIEATIENAQRRLLPGMFANVDVNAGETKKYLTLPQTAVTYNPYGSTVFVVVSQGTAAAQGAASAASTPASAASGGGVEVEQIFITTGPKRGDQVAVLSGLKEGQMVVTSGQLKLKNGTPVKIDNKVLPANSPNPAPQER